MIFYGRVKPKIKDGHLNNITCPNCEQQTMMKYSIYGKYFHIWWIPMFPYGKVNILECNSCKTTFNYKELPEHIKHKFELVKHKGFPVWYFSGLFLIIFAIAYFSYSNSKQNDYEKEYINAPAIGDVYSLESEISGHYTSMKVESVTTDSVFVIFNNYEIDKRFNIHQIDKDINYTNLNHGYTKEEIVSLYTEKTIYEVKRDFTE